VSAFRVHGSSPSGPSKSHFKLNMVWESFKERSSHRPRRNVFKARRGWGMEGPLHFTS
jgi:hypothetical protein